MAKRLYRTDRLWLSIAIAKVLCVWLAIKACTYYHIPPAAAIVVFTTGLLFAGFGNILRRVKQKEKVSRMLDEKVDLLDVLNEAGHSGVSVRNVHAILSDVHDRTHAIIAK